MQQTATKLPDREMAASIQRGDPLAEAALYEKYSSRVYFLALSELRSREDAEDVRAEVFIRIIEALRCDRLRNLDSLSPFIVGITLNVIREHTRQNLRTEPLSDREFETPDERSPESAFINREISRAIDQVFDMLKPRERKLLRMCYYEELPKEEIARNLDIDKERVRLVKSRALKKFREVYKRLVKS